MQYLTFLKLKRSGNIKGRRCADGQKRAYITKEEARYPTVATEALMLTYIIDNFQDKDVVTVDIPSDFMQADMYDIVNMKIQRKMVDLMIRIDPDKYMKSIMIEDN